MLYILPLKYSKYNKITDASDGGQAPGVTTGVVNISLRFTMQYMSCFGGFARGDSQNINIVFRSVLTRVYEE
jgi:hypothetical protein